jgi:hypothetical protein
MEHRTRIILFICLRLYERSDETLVGDARDALELDTCAQLTSLAPNPEAKVAFLGSSSPHRDL